MKTHVNAVLATVAVIGVLGLAATPAAAAPGAATGSAAQSKSTAPSARDNATTPSNNAQAPARDSTRSNNAPAGQTVTGPEPPSGTIPLAEVPDAKNTLSSIKIVDLKGDSVGSVDQVQFDNAGKPRSVRVDVGGFLGIGAKNVSLDANAVKFDPAKKVLVTSLSKEQLQAMPASKS